MKIAGIIAEYNPFHNGHAFQIAQTRQMGATHIIAVMSGWATQRGDFPCMTKAARCEAALLCGADLVLELPLPWSCASAERFASGGISILNSMGCVDVLSFGSETGDIGLFKKTASILLEAETTHYLKEALATGVSFPRAREIAASAIDPSINPELFKNPNDSLGLEYLKSLSRTHSRIIPFAVKRYKAQHNSLSPSGQIASASYLRELLADDKLDAAMPYMPQKAAAVVSREAKLGKMPFDMHAAELLMLSQLRRMSANDFLQLPDVSEGLENRIFSAIRRSTTLHELIFGIKTKRYTLSRIRRILMCAVLGITRDLASSSPPPYLRLLGFNDRGAEILTQMKRNASLPIVARKADFSKLPVASQSLYALDCLAGDLYGLCLPKPQPCGIELTYKPIFQPLN